MSIFHKWMVHCSFHFHLNRSFVYVKCRRMEVLHRSLSLSVIPFSLWLQSFGETIHPAACAAASSAFNSLNNTTLFFGPNLFSGCCFYEDISPNMVLVPPSQQWMFNQISTRHDAELGFGGYVWEEWVWEQTVQPVFYLTFCTPVFVPRVLKPGDWYT